MERKDGKLEEKIAVVSDICKYVDYRQTIKFYFILYAACLGSVQSFSSVQFGAQFSVPVQIGYNVSK